MLHRKRRDRRRLSLLRLIAVLAIVAGVLAVSVAVVRKAIVIAKTAESQPWYAPYVDATATPQVHFESPSSNPVDHAVLGFIVAAKGDECVPTWGTYFDLDSAATELDMDRRVARLRQRGGDITVSFGGAANDELALRCGDTADLVDAYAAVIDRYELTRVDFDIEGAALTDVGATQRRAAAVRQLQDRAAESGTRLTVWLTLPVAPHGMTDEAIDVIDAMLEAGVDLAGVNLMTMDYGESRKRPDGRVRSMVEATTDAVDASWIQLDRAYRRAGKPLTTDAVWRKLGITPMIGQNDVASERVSVDDAERMMDLAVERGLGRVSMWSLNRDNACGAQLDLGTVSNNCSGVEQEPLEFSNVFAPRGEVPEAGAATPPSSASEQQPTDDPARSPYPIWSDSKTYVEADKVTWHRNVYEAKWWSDGDVPDAPVEHEWDTPWRYLGPVLPTDVAPTTTTIPDGTYPTWSVVWPFRRGERVQLDGVAYEAKWWTQGDRPDKDADQPSDSPWEPVELEDEDEDR